LHKINRKLNYSFLSSLDINPISLVVDWDPSNFTFNFGDKYELVWQDEFENVDPAQAIIDGKPDPKNWGYRTGPYIDGGLQNFTDSIQNAYVQDGQLKIVAFKEGLTSAMLHSQNLQEFTFGVFAAKIQLPYGKGMWPAWWLLGDGDKYNLTWPTVGEIDILEMVGGYMYWKQGDQYAYGTVHWNNQSNTMNPRFNKQTNSWDMEYTR